MSEPRPIRGSLLGYFQLIALPAIERELELLGEDSEEREKIESLHSEITKVIEKERR